MIDGVAHPGLPGQAQSHKQVQLSDECHGRSADQPRNKTPRHCDAMTLKVSIWGHKSALLGRSKNAHGESAQAMGWKWRSMP
jgi:hypothetical protein